jgi:molybdopterin converting factor small subunit
MASITLSASLFTLVPEQERAHACARRSLSLDACTWPEATRELRARFPQLAQRILTESDSLAEGFLVAVNGALLAGTDPPRNLAAADEIHVIAQMAGG